MLKYAASIRFRLMVIAIVSLSGVALLMVVNASRILQATAEESIALSVGQTQETLNIAIAPYTTKDGLALLAEYFEEMVSEDGKGLVYLAITDDAGETLLATRTVPNPLPAPSADHASGLSEGIVHVRQPILLFGDQVGHLHFGLSARLLHDAIARLRHENTVLMVFAVTALVLAFSYLLVRLNRRIQRLMRVSENLAGGRYDSRADIEGEDEVAELANAFDHMAQAVEDRIRQLELSREQIANFNVELERTVAERTRELEQTLDHLRQTQRSLIQSEKLASLGSVVAAVAHELNTPIGNARTVATSLTEKNARFQNAVKSGLTRSTMDRFLEESSIAASLMERSLSRAADLIQSFKHVAVDQTSSHLRRFQLDQTIDDVLSTLRPSFKNTPFELTTDLAPGIEMNSYPGAIGQILTNVVTNAIHHGFADREHGEMRVEVRPVDAGHVEILFSDDGIGMSADVLEKVYDPFFTTTMGKGGSGLGMNIVHNLVTGLLGGEINVDSAPGRGTRVRMVLPLQAAAEAEDDTVTEDAAT